MIKLSHSGKNRFLECPQSYKLRYIDKLVSKQKSSALLFGSAIDMALNFMLENKDDICVVQKSMSIFDEHWLKQKDNKYDLVELPECEDIAYLKSDFDPLLLEASDLARLPKNWQFTVTYVADHKKELGWYNLESEERIVYNLANWLCLSRKAKLFIQAYHDQILPQIKRVIAVQVELKLVGSTGNEMTGFIDAIIELHDGRVAVLDNKTSSMAYTQDSVANSEQLALYMSILNIHCDDSAHPWKTRIDCCAYAVLSKKLKKDTTKVCQSCGHTSFGSHATCDALIGKKRCNGTWTKTYKFNVPTQFLVDNVPEKLQDQVLTNSENIIEYIENGCFEPNWDACNGQYGTPCEFYNYCRSGSMEGLIDMKNKPKDSK